LSRVLNRQEIRHSAEKLGGIPGSAMKETPAKFFRNAKGQNCLAQFSMNRCSPVRALRVATRLSIS
jgi:hypothetical protein